VTSTPTGDGTAAVKIFANDSAADSADLPHTITASPRCRPLPPRVSYTSAGSLTLNGGGSGDDSYSIQAPLSPPT
jgi:hypothetical protein